MKTFFRACAIGAVLGSAAAASLPLAAGPVSHPMITPYAGSTQVRGELKEFDAYKLITGVKDGNPVGQEIQGRVTRLGYNHPRERSILEVFHNYESAFAAAGMEYLFTCAEEECGPAFAASAWNRFNGIVAKSGADCRYLAGKLTREGSTAYVALLVGQQRHDIDIIEIRAMETGLVKVNADTLARGIERDGRVTVDGIYFDTDQATLKPESKPALDEVAKLMQRMPALKVWVVGHTDDTGSLESNMTLSQARARAVALELVGTYGIDVSRLGAHGVGPLVPASTNRDDAGRTRNRRVELVEQ